MAKCSSFVPNQHLLSFLILTGGGGASILQRHLVSLKLEKDRVREGVIEYEESPCIHTHTHTHGGGYIHKEYAHLHTYIRHLLHANTPKK